MEFNFSAASSLDDTVFVACRPGPWPCEGHTPATRVSDADVAAWASCVSRHGVTRVLSLLSDDEVAAYAVPVDAALAKAGITAIARVPPKEEGAFAAAMAFLDAAAAASSRVVIHCWGGGGRAGRVAAAWLVHRHGLSPAAAAAAVVEAAARARAARRVDAAALEAFVGTQPCASAHAALSLSAPSPVASAAAVPAAAALPAAPADSPLSFFDRYLTVWVALCMVSGALIGFFAPRAADALASAEVAGVNIIIAVLLWVMLLPMFLTLDFASALRGVRTAPAALLITTALNYAVKPFSMWAIGLLFTRVIYATAMPDAALRDSYVAGLVLLAGAPCTAMVFVWSALLGGSPGYTLAQVALNDALMLVLYVPICGALIGATGLALPWATIAACVGLFILAPLALASAARAAILRAHDEAFLRDKVVARVKPLTTLALLATLVLIFVFQGATLGSKTAAIFMLAVPITIQCTLLWALAYALCFRACIPHERTAPASLIATSNFFELAVAVAVAIYGPASGAALATVVGVLVEVPLMLAFVQLCAYLKPALDKRCAACEADGGCGTACGGKAAAGGGDERGEGAALCCGGGAGCGGGAPTAGRPGAAAAPSPA